MCSSTRPSLLSFPSAATAASACAGCLPSGRTRSRRSSSANEPSRARTEDRVALDACGRGEKYSGAERTRRRIDGTANAADSPPSAAAAAADCLDSAAAIGWTLHPLSSLPLFDAFAICCDACTATGAIWIAAVSPLLHCQLPADSIACCCCCACDLCVLLESCALS